VSGELRAPFPWFGGKSRIASVVWEVLGNVPNYVEPFFGSGAVLLARPHAPRIETVNDLDGMVSNFWRAVRAAPEEVAKHADWPVIEQDLHARHQWLVDRRDSLSEALLQDPEFYDAKTAGWWVWGACAWIGSGWCREISKKLPHLGNGGQGINKQLPHLGNEGQGINSTGAHTEWFRELSARLRRVRVASGDWSRVVTDSVTWRHGTTGVFLDPPYAEGNQQYASGGTGTDLSACVREWAIEHGTDPRFRIVLAGLEGEHVLPAAWRVVEWKARGGYGSTGSEENINRKRERLWFSPHCEGSRQRSLFGGAQ
jgi:hypothetical protein